MKKMAFFLISSWFVLIVPSVIFAETIDVLIKGIDDGVKTSRDRDYKEAVMNAKLQAIERAGVAVTAITKVENFQLKYDLIEIKASAVLLPGFQIIDMGYQKDGTYQVVLSGKVQTGTPGTEDSRLWGKFRSQPIEFKKFKEALEIWSEAAISDIENKYVNNENGTITDQKTGLMWLRSYEIKENILEVRQHIDRLNKNKFAGYSDWRTPTLSEIGTLIETKPGAKLKSGRESNLDAIFNAKPYCWYLWSADRSMEGYLLAYIGEKKGGISPAGDHYQSEGICVACIKAVRSIK